MITDRFRHHRRLTGSYRLLISTTTTFASLPACLHLAATSLAIMFECVEQFFSLCSVSGLPGWFFIELALCVGGGRPWWPPHLPQEECAPPAPAEVTLCRCRRRAPPTAGVLKHRQLKGRGGGRKKKPRDRSPRASGEVPVRPACGGRADVCLPLPRSRRVGPIVGL